MAKILFAGPEDRIGNNEEHETLIQLLEKLGNEVTYVKNSGDMIRYLQNNNPYYNESQDKLGPKRDDDLIVYDSRMFYGLALIKKRQELFEREVMPLLTSPKLPVVILTDKTLERIARKFESPLIRVINMPYNPEETAEEISSLYDLCLI